ncbi:type I restriction endonuclease subunit R [Pseudomonas aeruginosa]|uniref:type I restriction endonuclease subunit R n=1 Tax=Pseudomonas aeruginosa TaxID=287 RepID=UPI00053EA822|nr:type I restriction endonuclease subunit R [Pseudomonas aeruginosa]ALZ06982.1 type I restriction protein of type I restriction-modification system [Pseudomonas aeruginosa]EIU1689434.1 type I restriction endonuclease subunit R [Pseudomonas aeruginosa]EKV4826563.1 type I restriction endonuclease subunit R [Pseudomonas aeruginosa]KSR18529.1 type I restriction endonuclease [Pseudomonas aeruginosa]MBI8647050.1 type I restriction endonuclease subunit R [Pseudomonas aeruginosa]
MSTTVLTENMVEEVALAFFQESGLSTRLGTELDDAGERASATQCVLSGRLSAALHRLNPALSHDAVEQVVRTLSHPPQPTLIQNNRWFHSLLLDGVEVEYRDAKTGETRGGRARLVDFENPRQNDWLVVRQLTVTGPSGKHIRPDLVVLLNGLPLAVIELKDPTDTAADLNAAIAQLARYRDTAPDLFLSNLLLVASDGLLTRVGSITSGASRYTPWRPAEGGQPTLEALIRGLLEPERLLDYLRSCVAFEEDERGEIVKKIAGYHQFRAVRKARVGVLAQLKAPIGNGDGRGGVVWHTQGSGKSLTMLMLAGALVREPLMANPTIVVVTDRNDLDDQLFGTFAAGRALLRQVPVQAEDREHLKELLDRAAGGVVFTTIHKFTEAHGEISTRANVVVIADEAHRSQYGFVEGGARWMRAALPNATFIGFTGTPLERDDKNTIHVFGEYVDVYDIRQAVEDGATKPLYYESRIVKLTVDDAGANAAEAELKQATRADASGEEMVERIRIPLEGLVGAPERIAQLAAFIVEHWEKRRAAMEGKAMIVTMSREICIALYERIIAQRPDWHSDDDQGGLIKVIMNEGLPPRRQGETEEVYQRRIKPLIEPIRKHGRTKAARKRLAERFKNPADDFRLAIVCDMWLTGFDCPPAHTLYLDKPLAGHNLMQTIARVNRVYGDKPGGLVVDLLGLADQLADALATYTQAGGTGEAIRQVQDEAVPAMQTAFEKLDDFFHGCDYQAALSAEPQAMLPIYLHAIDHVLGQDDGWTRFRSLVKELSTAFALAVPRPETEAIVEHLAFFQRIAAMIRKRLADESSGTLRAQQSDVDAAVRQVIGGAVDADQVIDLFAVAGLDEARLDILSDEFLQRVAALEQKNLALETLRKLLADQIRVTERTNIVQSKKFREALEDAMLRYTNKAITTAEMIARLIDLAQELRAAQQHGAELGLNSEETAFFDALAENGSAKSVMQSDTLRLMARELVEMVKKMPKLDWTQRESVRADLRRSVRRLLAKYGYPPDLSDDATQLVLRQAEVSTESKA